MFRNSELKSYSFADALWPSSKNKLVVRVTLAGIRSDVAQAVDGRQPFWRTVGNVFLMALEADQVHGPITDHAEPEEAQNGFISNCLSEHRYPNNSYLLETVRPVKLEGYPEEGAEDTRNDDEYCG